MLNAYAAADAFPYTHNPAYSKYDQQIVRGEAARWAHHDPRPCLMPPDWSGGYTSIFALQQEEDWKAALRFTAVRPGEMSRKPVSGR